MQPYLQKLGAGMPYSAIFSVTLQVVNLLID